MQINLNLKKEKPGEQVAYYPLPASFGIDKRV
jgi:hypothetical protein